MNRSISARLGLILLAGAHVWAQAAATGTINITPATPGSVVATAGSVVVGLSANAVPATAVTVTVTLGTTKSGPFTYAIPAGGAITLGGNNNGDAVTVILNAVSGTPGISWSAVATPGAAGALSVTKAGSF